MKIQWQTLTLPGEDDRTEANALFLGQDEQGIRHMKVVSSKRQAYGTFAEMSAQVRRECLMTRALIRRSRLPPESRKEPVILSGEAVSFLYEMMIGCLVPIVDIVDRYEEFSPVRSIVPPGLIADETREGIIFAGGKGVRLRVIICHSKRQMREQFLAVLPDLAPTKVEAGILEDIQRSSMPEESVCASQRLEGFSGAYLFFLMTLCAFESDRLRENLS